MRCAVFVRSEKSGRLQRASDSSTQDVIKQVSSSVAALQAHTMPRISRSLSVQGIGSCSVSKVQKSCHSESSCSRPSGGGRHIQPPTGSSAAKLKHKCPFEGCPWRFATPYKLRRHIKSHTKETPYQCKECGRGFSVRYNLLMHIQTIHSVPQKFRCPLKGCKEAFHTQSRLNGHLRRIHKKDWKQLQQTTQQVGSSTSDADSGTNSSCSSEPSKPRSHSTSSLPPPSVTTTASSFPCSECGRGFSSQPKLSAHMRTHSSDRPYKCNIQSCQKAFSSAEKLSKHLECHKGAKQFSCPYENCHRIFLRQSHLKNHLKIHTRDQFTCPVADCRAKFATESEYNMHLNTHMSYQHQCPHSGCQLTFPTQKRLDLHCRVSHLSNHEAGIKVASAAAPSLALSPTATIPTNLSPANQLDCRSEPHQHDILNYVGATRELLENLELPDLKVEDIEAVISEHTDWSGEQIESFFRSLELNEVECTRSLSGYESDSGYSTYDVSPLASGMSYTGSLSPAITPVTPNPIFPPPTSSPTSATPLNPFQEEFLGTSLSATISPPPPLSSASSSDGNYFGAFEFPPLPGTPTDSQSEHSLTPPALYSSDYYMAPPQFHFPPASQAQPHAFHMQYLPMSVDGVRSVTPATTNLSSIEDGKHTVILVPNSYAGNGMVMPSTVASSPLEAPIQIKLEPGFASGQQHFNCHLQFPTDLFSMAATPPCTPVSIEERQLPVNPSINLAAHASRQSEAAVTLDHNNCISEIPGLCLPGIKQKIEAIMQPKAESPFKKTSCKEDKPRNAVRAKSASDAEQATASEEQKESRTVYARILSKSGDALTTSSDSSSPSETQAPASSKSQAKSSRSGSCTKLRQQRSGSVPMKSSQRKKSQWPKSMNPGNLVAFRNFILNKLKKGQEHESLASSLSSTKPLMHHPMVHMPAIAQCERPQELSFVPNKTASLGALRGEYSDLLAEMAFNPDSLLSSESSGDSPLGVLGGGTPLEDFGLSLADEMSLSSSALHNPSNQSESPLHVSEATMDIDGCVQFFTEDPITQSLSESNLPSSFIQDLDNIFKTDRDPLLGALS